MPRLDERPRGQRDATFDALRGAGIFLVVLAHAVQFAAGENCHESLVFQAIYSFHMPLFFVISGFLFKRPTSVRSGLARMKRRGLCLLVPYLVWTLLWHVCHFASDGHVGVRAAWATIWFLPVLLACFWTHTTVALIGGVRKWPLSEGVMGSIVVLAMYLVGSAGFWLGSIRYHYIFFLVGAMLGGRYRWRDLSDVWVAVGCAALWVLILPYRQAGLSALGLGTHSHYARVLHLGLRLVIAFLAIYAVSSVVTISPSSIVRRLSSIGLYSLHIYLIHIGLARFLCSDVAAFGVAFWFSVGVMMGVPVLIGKIAGSYTYASLTLFGRPPVGQSVHSSTAADPVGGSERGARGQCPDILARGTRM